MPAVGDNERFELIFGKSITSKKEKMMQPTKSHFPVVKGIKTQPSVF